MSHRDTLKSIYFKALDTLGAKNLIANAITLNDGLLTIQNDIYALNPQGKLYLLSVGKAGLQMAQAAEGQLGSHIDGGVAISHEEGECTIVKHYTSTHPLVSQKSLDACEHLISALESMRSDDFFIFCLSGGASAMIEKPIAGLTLDEFGKISSALLGAGIDIKALNSVRKSISQIKGGKLASFTLANGVVLVLSDVLGDDLSTIGSGPMFDGQVPHYIIGNNTLALEAAYDFIFPTVEHAKVVTTTLAGTSDEAASYIKECVEKYDRQYDSFCLLFGGETMTEVIGDGQGGRNQELALRLLLKEVISDDISLLVAGSDGIDGNSPATGAFLDSETLKMMHEKNIDPLRHLAQSDSYGFFKSLGADFTTGATGTNVMDFVFILKNKRKGK